ncbi:MAG: hypothetical protein H5U01_03045, partial [Clostridia bacterium]|nr:hypothetical protein [Clostridia bacterium]
MSAAVLEPHVLAQSAVRGRGGLLLSVPVGDPEAARHRAPADVQRHGRPTFRLLGFVFLDHNDEPVPELVAHLLAHQRGGAEHAVLRQRTVHDHGQFRPDRAAVVRGDPQAHPGAAELSPHRAHGTGPGLPGNRLYLELGVVRIAREHGPGRKPLLEAHGDLAGAVPRPKPELAPRPPGL